MAVARISGSATFTRTALAGPVFRKTQHLGQEDRGEVDRAVGGGEADVGAQGTARIIPHPETSR